jgi:3-methyl-2-oxobutanoate hydroxymethyltransferase
VTSVRDFARFKTEGRKISMVTAYDAWSARLVGQSSVDAILVGDSVAMVVHGHATTVSATVPMMALHTAAVARAVPNKFLVADLPFLSYRRGLAAAIKAVGSLVRSGAHGVKLEGIEGHRHVIRQIVGSGVPVMGHVGLTPQSVNRLGGFRVQGREPGAADRILRRAHDLEDAGCFAVVLECIPGELAAHITSELTIPTVGIGGGPCTDGQILVLQDLWGVSGDHVPRFVRRYADGNQLLTDALNRYDADIKAARFPSAQESYS